MKRGGAPRCLETVAGHYFQRMFAQSGAIGREQDVAVSLSQLECINEQFFEIVFNMKRLSSGRTRKGRRIENDHIKFLPLARKPGQYRHYVVGNEAMVDRWQTVERKILSPPRQRFLGKIHIKRGRSNACRANRKGAGVGETVQESLWRDVAHVAPVFPLIYKEARRIALPEVDSKLEVSLCGDCLQIFAGVAKRETRVFALFIFARDGSGENASKLKPDAARPRL